MADRTRPSLQDWRLGFQRDELAVASAPLCSRGSFASNLGGVPARPAVHHADWSGTQGRSEAWSAATAASGLADNLARSRRSGLGREGGGRKVFRSVRSFGAPSYFSIQKSYGIRCDTTVLWRVD